MNLKQIQDKLARRGFRRTRVRSRLLRIMNHSTAPKTASELLNRLNRREPRPNKTTVYRELATLLQEKIIVPVDFGDGQRRYELQKSDHHHHVVCLGCRKVADARLKRELVEEEKRLSHQLGFAISSHSLEFFGLCQRCQ